jgi:chromosome partitioning protein
MRTVAITNQKGGSGKTTTAVNLAAALGERGASVLLIDLDPQASASAWFGVVDESRGLLDVLLGESTLGALVRDTSVQGVSLVPASAWLVGAERALAGEVGAETLLRSQFGKLPAGRWDWVLVDCPPTLGVLALQALVGCRELLVPVTAEAMAVAGLAALLQTLQRVQQRLNPKLVLLGILACRVDTRTRLAREVVEALRQRFGSEVFQATIRESVRLTEAPSHHQPITTYAPDSHGAEDYRALAAELMGAKVRRKS